MLIDNTEDRARQDCIEIRCRYSTVVFCVASQKVLGHTMFFYSVITATVSPNKRNLSELSTYVKLQYLKQGNATIKLVDQTSVLII